jgi:tripartite ATP-independent transporter DctP family solute receptor
MKKCIVFALVLVWVLVFSVGLSSAAGKPIKLKLAHLGKGDPFKAAAHAGAVNFAHMMKKGSAGKYEVDIFPRGTLGKETDLLQAVRSGAVQFIIASMVSLHRIFPPAQVMMAPYTFRNDAVAWEVFDGPYGQKLLDAMTEKTGIKALAIQDLGFLTITNNKRPTVNPEDFKGIKFRAMGPLQANMFKALGASAVPIPWPEVYTSLQTGVADGQTNAAFVVRAFKIYEVQKYMALANSQMGYQIYLCNKRWYDSLSAADKAVLRDAIKAARLTARNMGLLLESQATEALTEEGMQIYPLTGDQVAVLQKLAGPACLDWLRTQMEPVWVDEMLKAVEAAETKLGYR